MIDEMLEVSADNKIALIINNYNAPKQTVEDKKVKGAMEMFKPKKSMRAIRHKTMRPHDMLRVGGGVSLGAVCAWWTLGKCMATPHSDPTSLMKPTEVLPFFSRLELEFGAWVPRHWPPNLGANRDIPEDAEIHHSVYRLYKAGVIKDLPKLGGDGRPLLQGLATAVYRFNAGNEENHHCKSEEEIME
jgi:hypothetical protein